MPSASRTASATASAANSPAPWANRAWRVARSIFVADDDSETPDEEPGAPYSITIIEMPTQKVAPDAEMPVVGYQIFAENGFSFDPDLSDGINHPASFEIFVDQADALTYCQAILDRHPDCGVFVGEIRAGDIEEPTFI